MQKEISKLMTKLFFFYSLVKTVLYLFLATNTTISSLVRSGPAGLFWVGLVWLLFISTIGLLQYLSIVTLEKNLVKALSLLALSFVVEYIILNSGIEMDDLSHNAFRIVLVGVGVFCGFFGAHYYKMVRLNK